MKPEGEVLGEVLGEVFEQHLPFGNPVFIGFPDEKGRWGGVSMNAAIASIYCLIRGVVEQQISFSKRKES